MPHNAASTLRMPNTARDDSDYSASKPTKRRRKEREEAELIRDAEFWYEDGTVILVAGDVQFKLYKGVLARCSPIFADLFVLPQPVEHGEDAGTTSCPVVHLSGDSPFALRHIFRVLLPSEPAPLSRQKPSFHMISAYARIGHKYQIESLQREASSYLESYITPLFEKWQAHSTRYCPEGFEHIHTIGVVNISRLLERPAILPTALLSCCQIDAPDLFRSFQHEDGMMGRLNEADMALHADLAKTHAGIRVDSAPHLPDEHDSDRWLQDEGALPAKHQFAASQRRPGGTAMCDGSFRMFGCVFQRRVGRGCSRPVLAEHVGTLSLWRRASLGTILNGL